MLRSREEEACDVEENGGGEAEGINSVHDASVAFDKVTVIFNAAVAFDGGHDESTGEAEPGNQE